MRTSALVFLIATTLAGSACTRADKSKGPDASKPELLVYAYDTLLSEGGWGRAAFPRFEKTCGCRLTLVSVGDAGQLASRLQMDRGRGKTRAHVALGVDQHTARLVREHVMPWGDWRPIGWDKLSAALQVIEPDFLPFDQGALGFMADTETFAKRKLPMPGTLSLAALTAPAYRRSILLQDPRVSAPGFAFVAYTWTKLGGGRGFHEFWKTFRTQWLTLTPGWDSAYALFLRGEAPLVWSYTTSQAYHRSKGDVGRYRSIPLEGGGPVQVEGAMLLRDAPEPGREVAKRFLEFLISEEAQARIPETNWMFPVRDGIRLPASFRDLPAPKESDWGERSVKPSEILKRWEEAVRS